MHNFFADERTDYGIARRIYARPIEWFDNEYLLFDGVDADFFDEFRTDYGNDVSILIWHQHIERARIYAIEVDALSEPQRPSEEWLRFAARRSRRLGRAPAHANARW